MQQTSNASNHTFLAVMLAGLAGVVIGMLFAPREGKETRRRLRTAVTEAEDQATKGLEKAQLSLKKGLRHTQDFKDRLQNAWHEGTATAQEDEFLPPTT